MQNQFNLTRFGRLFKKHTAEHYKGHFMSLVVLLGVLTLILGFLTYMEKRPLKISAQTGIFCFGLLAAGTIFTSSIFSNLGDKKTAIPALTLPASHFEKYLLAWIYSFVLFLIFYTAAFYLVNIIILNLAEAPGKPKQILNVFDTENEIYQIYLAYTFLHAFTIWGAIYFQKMHFVKIAFTFFLSVAALVLLNYSVMKAMLGTNVRSAVPFGSVTLQEGEYQKFNNQNYINYQYFNLSVFEEHSATILIGFMLMAIMLWLASYMRLKEKQV